MSNTAIAYQDRKALGAETNLCTRTPGCGKPQADDSMFCADHRDAQRGYARAWKRKVTRRNRRAKRCACGRPRRKGDRWCLRCRVASGRVAVLAVVENPVEKSERIAAQTRKHEDGRTRYHGQARRGQQPRPQLDAQDLAKVRAAIRAGELGLRQLETAEVAQLGRIQRQEVEQAACGQLELAARYLADIAGRHWHARLKHGVRCGQVIDTGGAPVHVFVAGARACVCGDVAAG